MRRTQATGSATLKLHTVSIQDIFYFVPYGIERSKQSIRATTTAKERGKGRRTYPFSNCSKYRASSLFNFENYGPEIRVLYFGARDVATYHLSIKSGKKGKAANHAAYITRQGKHSKGSSTNDLVATATGNLPSWTNGDPAAFWKAADTYERANGAAYREFELALPRELTLQQQVELTTKFLQDEIPGKPFQVAIHSPTASLGRASQPHAHAMYSDRVDDGIHRAPDQHFRRFNPWNPEIGGCKKDSGGKDRVTLREEVIRFRERWADLQNEALAQHGHVGRVDHRTLVQQGCDRTPEYHLGQARIKKMSSEEKDEYIRVRDSQAA